MTGWRIKEVELKRLLKMVIAKGSGQKDTKKNSEELIIPLD